MGDEMSSKNKQKTIWDKALAAMKKDNTPVVAQMTKEVMASIRSYVTITPDIAEALNVLADYLSQNPAYRNDAADAYLFALKGAYVDDKKKIRKQAALGLSRTIPLIEDKHKRAFICGDALNAVRKFEVICCNEDIRKNILKAVIDAAPSLEKEKSDAIYESAIMYVRDDPEYFLKAFRGNAKNADESSDVSIRLWFRFTALCAACLVQDSSAFSKDVIPVAEKFVSDIGGWKLKNKIGEFLSIAQEISNKFENEGLKNLVVRKMITHGLFEKAAKLVKPKSGEDKLLSERVEKKLPSLGGFFGKVRFCAELGKYSKEGETAAVVTRVFTRGMKKLSATEIFSLKGVVERSENLTLQQLLATALLAQASDLPTKTEQIKAYAFTKEYAATPQEKQAAQQKCEEIQADWPRCSLTLGVDVFVKKAAALKRPAAQP